MNRVDYNRYEVNARKPQRRVRERRKILPMFLKPWMIVAVLILGLIGYRMATMEAELKLETTFAVPEGVSLDGISVSGVKMAAAVDGDVTISDEEVRPTASTTKMILALAVMEKKPFALGEKGEEIEITQEMYDIRGWYLSHNGSNTLVEVGEKISEYDALVSTLLASSNNMADSLAIWAFGSLEEYQKYATEMLSRLGAKKTTIGSKDASGYDSSTTSTASDLARIGYFVMKNPVLAQIVALESAEVPIAGRIENTNKLLGRASISGVKTGYIGDESGYCLVSGYKVDEHIITVAVLGASTRDGSFDQSLSVVKALQEKLEKQEMLKRGDEVGYYESWWTGKVSVKVGEGLSEINYKGAEKKVEILEDAVKVKIGETEYTIPADVPSFSKKPSLIDRFLHVFGWKK
ncbi:D-alanyl-D-alanine carboxypeptidase [Candidatus Saccharibacteria bacterium]|nr:D-alanyl-D-alanine carboxypeptidase [Candidatus Saccharibacteria bacterium]